MAQIFRIWWPVFVAMLLVQMGNGLTGTLISVTGESNNLSPLLQGLILSAFFGGSLAGAFSAPLFIARTSHVTSLVAYTIALSLATFCFALTNDPLHWIVIRLVAGAAITGLFATIESWLNLGTQDVWRARVFAIYIFVQLGGLASGQLLLNARSVGIDVLFIFAGLLILSSAFLMRFERVQNPKLELTKYISVFRLAARAPLGVLCVSLSGFAWAGLMASGPAVAETMGLSDFEKSLFMALAVFSGMAAQLPIGWLADHFDRRIVLASLTAVAGAGALTASLSPSLSVLFLFAFVFGAATFPLYAVGVACINEVLAQSERTSASAVMIVFFDFGAVIAPLLLAFATAMAGPRAYFVVQALPQLAFAFATLLALRRRHSSTV